MKFMRWAMCMAAFAFAGEVAKSEDYIDIGAMQAKLAAQEARLNDLQAKVYGNACDEPEKIVADGLTSLRKNATVTIGGTVNTRYEYFSAKVDSVYSRDANGALTTPGTPNRNRVNVEKVNYGQLNLADAKLEGKIDVNEYFDAYFRFDLQDGDRANSGIDSPANAAQNYWVRWKNICNSGFGILVGRDSLRFGGVNPTSRFDTWGVGGIADSGGNYWGSSWYNGNATGMSISGGMPNRPTVSAFSRVVQITPYWENKDGSFKAEVSLFQAPEYYARPYSYQDDQGRWNRRRMNNGFGSFSGKITWKPVDGLTVVGSVMNLHANNFDGRAHWSYPQGVLHPNATWEVAKNNWATNLGISYRPAFFNKLNLYATWTHGWNDGWMKDQDSDSFGFGFDLNLTDSIMFYETFEIVRSKANGTGSADWNIHKANGWANEVGLKYTSSYGIWANVGWRHEDMRYKNRAGFAHTKAKADAFYTTLGFNF